MHRVLGRRGARLAEVMTLSQNLLPRPSRLRKAERQKGVAAAVAAFAAAEAEAAAAAAAGSKHSNGVSGSPSTSVVSAPDWPPVSQQRGQQQAAAASDGGEEEQQKRQRRKQQQDRQQQPAPAPAAAAQRGAAAPSPAANGGGGSQQADLTAFLRSAGGASRLRLDAWEDVDPDAKRLKDSLLRKVCAWGVALGWSWPGRQACIWWWGRIAWVPPSWLADPIQLGRAWQLNPATSWSLLLLQEAPKKRRRDIYDVEYDMGRTKKVRNKQQAEGDDGEDGGGGGVDGRSFDAAWQQKQRDGVQTELRGNRKRRSEDFQQQQQRHSGSGGGSGRHSPGGRGRGGGRHGGGRSPGGRGGGRYGGGRSPGGRSPGGRGGSGRHGGARQSFGGSRGGGRHGGRGRR
jgi:hypothetical protein